MPNLYRSFAPIQIVHRGLSPMGLSLPCGKARKRANEGWPLPARCGNRRAWAEMETGPVCLRQRRRGWGMCCWLRGDGGGRRVGWVREISFDIERRPGERGSFAHCGERPKALPLEKSSRRLDFQESPCDSCQTNAVGLHHPLKRCGQGQLRWPGNFSLPTAW